MLSGSGAGALIFAQRSRFRENVEERRGIRRHTKVHNTPNLPTNMVDFSGLDSSTILLRRGGILMSTGNFLESLSQAMLVGTRFVGRLGVGGLRIHTKVQDALDALDLRRSCQGDWAYYTD